MRSAEQVFEELEEDRASREREIRLIENIISRTAASDEQDMLRRSLVLLTYSHLEGYCKFALNNYASAVNALKIACKDASVPLVALTLKQIFSALRDPNSKHKEFAKVTDDRELQMLARERRFIENYDAILAATAEIPDHAVDTKSNLSAMLLKRNLYQLGLSYPIVDQVGGTIDRLRGVRNAIAHGDKLKQPKPTEVAEYLAKTFEVMKFVQSEVFTSLRDKIYQRDASITLPPPVEPTKVQRTFQYLMSLGR